MPRFQLLKFMKACDELFDVIRASGSGLTQEERTTIKLYARLLTKLLVQYEQSDEDHKRAA